ncbi:hypothetical protein [Streptomyces spiramenti]|uniref:Lipoprotein n=1 Tax=Streptomyces spiramenti TaxID=2720606 RepID=A0ABX1AKP1_9ACTN|nr:hypothetical protein [Streptomyces spiramenti]NJP67679.1 hypothetical protein [Streptomyces spiramenti]
MEETDTKTGRRPVRARDIGLAVVALVLLAGAWGCARLWDGPPVPRGDVRETTGRMQSALQTAYDVVGHDGEVPEVRLRASQCYETGGKAMHKRLDPGVHEMAAEWSVSVTAQRPDVTLRRVTEALRAAGWSHPPEKRRADEQSAHLRQGAEELTLWARPASDLDTDPVPDTGGVPQPDTATDALHRPDTAALDVDRAYDPGASIGERWIVSVAVRSSCARQEEPARDALPLLAPPTPEEAERLW